MHGILKPVFDILFELCAFALDLSATAAVIPVSYTHLSEEKISENTYLMALNASSNNDYIVGLYAVAAVLALSLIHIFCTDRDHPSESKEPAK